MSDNVHVDHEAIMDSMTVDFNKAYENFIQRLEESSGLGPEIMEKLYAKREFGIKKYGKEHSFQCSFDNAMKMPIYDQLMEEVIDALNYSLHTYFQQMFEATGVDKDVVEIIDQLRCIYETARAMKTIRSAKLYTGTE